MTAVDTWYNQLEDMMITLAHKKEIENVNLLLAALQKVEWVGAVTRDYCPWCKRWSGDGHEDDCQRQIAIAAVLPPK